VKKAASTSNKGNHRRLLRQNNSSLLRHRLPALPHQRHASTATPAPSRPSTLQQHHIRPALPHHHHISVFAMSSTTNSSILPAL